MGTIKKNQKNGRLSKVSVVIPTCNRYSVLLRNVENIREQKHPVEIVVCDDSLIEDYKTNHDLIKKIKNVVDQYHYTALYDHEQNKIYGLGRARNRGVIEANGEIVVFLDDRITPANDKMVSVFVAKLNVSKNRSWLFGDKGAHKTSFVENCSAVRRREIIISGMFPETINSYGFMTREVYARHRKQGFEFTYIPTALAKPLCTGSRRSSPERQQKITLSRKKLRKMGLI